MEIGGYDNFYEKAAGKLQDYLELMATIWPDAIFEELEEPTSVRLKEVFVYKNQEGFDEWSRDVPGFNDQVHPGAIYPMLYFIWDYDDNGMTVVSDNPNIPEIKEILVKIKNLAEGKPNG